MERRNFTRSARIAALVGAALFGAQAATAASVRSVSVDDMIASSEVVFEGRVLGRRFVDDGDARHLRTCVRFAVIDVVKGPDLASPVELCFAGGRAKNGVTTSVGGLELPEPGEHGIYFVESLAQRTLTPLFGWDQGRFVVGGDGDVATAGGEPVVALDGDADTADSDGLSNGVARGARVAERGARGAGAMDVDAFKARVREIAGEGN